MENFSAARPDKAKLEQRLEEIKKIFAEGEKTLGITPGEAYLPNKETLALMDEQKSIEAKLGLSK